MKGSEGSLTLSRRTFLKATGALSAATALGAANATLLQANMAWAAEGSAAGAAQVFKGACPSLALCTAVCPLMVTVQGGRITQIENHPDYPCCMKGHALRTSVYDPSRLKYPMVRTGDRGQGQFQRVTWDEAISTYAGKIKEYISAYGNESILWYPARGVSGLARAAAKSLLPNLLGGMVRTWGSLCIANKGAAAPTVYGTGNSESDLDTIKDSKLAIIWGYGFADSNRRGDFAGEGMKILMDAKAAGTRIVVIDPFFCQTAAKADQWIPINPGTDGAMALAMSNVVINQGLYDAAFVDRFVLGFDEFKAHVQQYTPEWAAEITGVPAAVISELAVDFATQQPSALFPGDGPSRVGHDPSQWVRACGALSAIVGSVGKPGTNAVSGQAFPKSISSAALESGDLSQVKVRINECQIGDAILTGKALQASGQVADVNIRLMIAHGASVINQAGDSNKIVEALKKLEYLIVADQFMTPLARYADLLLPATTIFEGSNVGYYGSSGHAITYAEQAIDPMYECKSDLEMWGAVADQLGIGADFHSDWTDADWMRETLAVQKAPHMADVTLDRLQAEHVVFVGPRPYIPFQAQVNDGEPFPTESGKIELYSASQEAAGLPALPTYLDDFENARHPLAAKYPLAICTPHDAAWLHSRSNNPWANELTPVQVFINTADAASRKIADGDTVVVYNDRGATQRIARVGQRVPVGVVALPQGPWYNPGPDGVDLGGSVNILTTDEIDRLGGSGTYNSVLVEIRKA
jgi:anaerobic dimethyl sulfoxide reductase subunit A